MDIIRIFFNIILLKSKPDEVPFNVNYTILAFVAVCFAGMLTTSMNQHITQPFAFIFVQTATLAGLISLFLLAAQKSVRTAQTLLALFGTSTMLQLAIFAISVANIYILLLVLGIWSFVVQTYIIKHALEVGIIQAFFISLGVQMSMYFMLMMVFPNEMQAIFLEAQQAQGQISNSVVK